MGLDRDFLVCVHLGAGYHSKSKKQVYSELIEKCCIRVIDCLKSDPNDMATAVAAGIALLENSGLVNAGVGSNKTSEGYIETDAAIMTADPYYFAAVGACKSNSNPIEKARKLLRQVQNSGEFSKVIYGCEENISQLTSSRTDSLETLFDTVGLVCLDIRKRKFGVGCSSGGPEGKVPGRIGPCAMPGIGFWITEDGRGAALCTGVGEQIAIKGGARAVLDLCLAEAHIISDEEYKKLYVVKNQKLEYGFIALTLYDRVVEVISSHSTPSFIFGFKIDDEKTFVDFSSLGSTKQASQSHMQQVDAQLEALEKHKKLIREHREKEAKLRELRFGIKDLEKKYQKSEDDIKALQSVGQIIGEVLKQIDDEKFIVKSSNGPRYIVGCRSRINKKKLVQGVRVTLDMTTLTIMRILPREVDPLVYNMSTEDPGDVSFEEVGGLGDQIRELREVIELPILNPELFKRIGVKAPKGVLLYGPPGTGKTLLARAVAASLDVNFLKVVSSAIVDKYIGESARVIREMFAYAKDHAPCIIFMDEIDAIGGRRFSEGNSSDREVQRTLMELLNQMDGFDELGQVKIIMATNRPDTLDPALLRPGRLDRKIEISLPNENGRADILRIHSMKINKQGDINFDPIVKLSEGFNGADLRNVVTEAGMFAIREERDYIIQDDLMKAVRKVGEAKKLETKLDYQKV